MPTPAVSQIVAAVVSPRTASRRTKINPPPMNPIPDTICAATRDGSRITRWERTSVKPYFETSMIRADATPTSACVRSPALRWRISRSRPISEERTNASAR